MKQVLAINYALIMMDEPMVLNHPTTIFTDDDVDVIISDTEDDLNYKISQQSPDKFIPLPDTGSWCEVNVVYGYGNKMIKCLQSHYRMHFAPEDTPALFLIIEPTGEDYPVWVQPTGAHDAYRKGDKVHFPKITDPIYESLIDYNTYSPAAYPAGWKKL